MKVSGALYSTVQVRHIAKTGGFNLDGVVYCRVTLPPSEMGSLVWQVPIGSIFAMNLETHVVRVFHGDHPVTPVDLSVAWKAP